MTTRTERLVARLSRRAPWVDEARRVAVRYTELRGGPVGSEVALRLFLSLFPLLLVSIAVVGFVSHAGNDVAGRIISSLGLRDPMARTVRDAVANAEHSRRAASAVGLLGLAWAGLGVVQALARAIDLAWQVPEPRGVRARLLGLPWLAGALLIGGASFGLSSAVAALPGVLAPLDLAIALGLDLLLWWWTLWLLGSAGAGWRALRPGAVVGAVGFAALQVVGTVAVPRLVSSSSSLYGPLGVVFAILVWLLLVGRLVVVASITNVVRWEQHHGTAVVEITVPRLPGRHTAETDRSGTALDNQSRDGTVI